MEGVTAWKPEWRLMVFTQGQLTRKFGDLRGSLTSTRLDLQETLTSTSGQDFDRGTSADIPDFARRVNNDLSDKPDIVFPRLRKVIFVHGCFWHQHGRCIDGRLPKSRTSYWTPKLSWNRKRDQANRRKLRRLGWESFVIWDCQTRNPVRLQRRLIGFLQTDY